MKLQDLKVIKELPVNELEIKVRECDQKIFQLRFSKSIAEVKNPLEIRNLRRLKARLLTWIQQKKTQGVPSSK